jgi:transcriptional regulator with XRE-family HTH domain
MKMIQDIIYPVKTWVTILSSLSERLKELRKRNGKLQKDIAHLLSVSDRHYRLCEAGEVDIPMSKLVMLADYFGVPIDYLVGRTDHITPTNDEVLDLNEKADQGLSISDSHSPLENFPEHIIMEVEIPPKKIRLLFPPNTPLENMERILATLVDKGFDTSKFKDSLKPAVGGDTANTANSKKM